MYTHHSRDCQLDRTKVAACRGMSSLAVPTASSTVDEVGDAASPNMDPEAMNTTCGAVSSPWPTTCTAEGRVGYAHRSTRPSKPQDNRYSLANNKGGEGES